MGHADRAAGFRPKDRVTFGIDRHHDIGAFAPLIRHRQGHIRALRADREILDRQDAVRRHNDLCLALIGRNDRDVGALASRWGLLRPDDADAVRGLGAIFRDTAAPANIEIITGDGRRIRVRAFHDQFMAAPIETGDPDLGAAAFRRRHDAFIDLGDRARPAPAPLVAIAVPVIMIVDGEEFPGEPLGDRLALLIHRDDFIGRVLAFLDRVFKAGLQADIKPFRAKRNPHAFCDGAAAGLQHADHGIDAQRTSGIAAGIAGGELDRCHPCPVRRRVIHFQDALAEALIMLAEGESLEVGERVRRRFDPRFGLDRQACARRAIEET